MGVRNAGCFISLPGNGKSPSNEGGYDWLLVWPLVVFGSRLSVCQVHLATSRPLPMQHLLLIALYSGQSEVHARMCHVWMRSIDVTILWPQKCVLRRWMAGSNGCVIATVTFTVDVMVTADFWCNWCYQGYMTTYPLHINCLCCVFTHFS